MTKDVKSYRMRKDLPPFLEEFAKERGLTYDKKASPAQALNQILVVAKSAYYAADDHREARAALAVISELGGAELATSVLLSTIDPDERTKAMRSLIDNVNVAKSKGRVDFGSVTALKKVLGDETPVDDVEALGQEIALVRGRYPRETEGMTDQQLIDEYFET